MADELDLELEDDQDKLDKFDKRIKGLSEQKVKLTSERDELAKAKESLEAEKATLSKEADFFKNFNTLTPKYQNAAEFQDKIKEKVMAGYDIEDATISILAKEGKYTPTHVEEHKESPAGGSAVNNIKSDKKDLSEMTREEKRAKLMESESEIVDLLSPKTRI